MPEAQPEVLLDLAIPRKIRLHDRGRAFTVTCRRVEPADWLRFFAAIVVTSEQDGEQRITSADRVTPAIQLAQSVIVAAEGYKVEGGAEIASLADWQTRLPIAHLHRIGMTLTSVAPSAPTDDFVIRAEGEEVSIDAAWSLDETTRKMMGFTGLKHIFKTPTQAQQKSYYSASSRSIVVGGSRTGKTIYASAQETLCELYDELILKVEGYGWKGEPMTEPWPPSVIRNQMDLYHKFIVAEQLFNPASVSTEAPSD